MEENNNSVWHILGLVIVVGGIYWGVKNNQTKNTSVNSGSNNTTSTGNTNAATQAGMPYSLDLTKINGYLYNNTYNITKGTTGYCIEDKANNTYIYDFKTGAFISVIPAVIATNASNNSVNQPLGSHPGAIFTIDDSFYPGGFLVYPDGSAVAPNDMPLGIYKPQNKNTAQQFYGDN